MQEFNSRQKKKDKMVMARILIVEFTGFHTVSHVHASVSGGLFASVNKKNFGSAIGYGQMFALALPDFVTGKKRDNDDDNQE